VGETVSICLWFCKLFDLFHGQCSSSVAKTEIGGMSKSLVEMGKVVCDALAALVRL
jgi:hypothetical protein